MSRPETWAVIQDGLKFIDQLLDKTPAPIAAARAAVKAILAMGEGELKPADVVKELDLLRDQLATNDTAANDAVTRRFTQAPVEKP